MNVVIISIIVTIVIGISIGLYFLFRKKDTTNINPPVLVILTNIIFQTSCNIKFLLTEPPNEDIIYKTFLFSPEIDTVYNASDLAKQITDKAKTEDFPLSVVFLYGKFNVLCIDENRTLFIVDEESDSTTTVVSHYGEAERFLNHLQIEFPISYFPSDLHPVKELQSSRNLTGLTISVNTIPNIPINLVVIPGNNSITISWTPTMGCKTGIYLKCDQQVIQSWDLVSENIGVYTFENIPNDTYIVGISSVGEYDESIALLSPPVTLYPPPPSRTIRTLNLLDNKTVNNKLKSGNTIYNTYGIATDFDTNPPINWPPALTKQNQILNINIKYYTQLKAKYFGFPTLPSDSRIEMEEGGTSTGVGTNYRLLDYMYYKKITPLSTLPMNYVFGSTDFAGDNQGGPPLPWRTKIISDRNIINAVFPENTSGNIISQKPPNLRFYCGYKSNEILIDSSQVPIEEYSIVWEEIV